MKRKSNIHAIINARELARKLIDVDPNNKGASLQVPNLVLMNFDKYLENHKRYFRDVSKINVKYISKKVLEYTHSSKASNASDAYMEDRFEGDFSPFSFYDSCERILSKEKEIADCAGFSSVDKFILKAKGILSRSVRHDSHVSLEIKNNRKFILLETTSPDGYGYKNQNKRLGNVDLISIILFNLGSLYDEERNYSKAIDTYTRAIKISSKNEDAYNNRGHSLSSLSKFKEAILDYTEAIRINPGYGDTYFNRAITLKNLCKYKESLLDLKKYASFSKSNASEVADKIKNLKEKIKASNQNGK
ncbi:tetratricopeptide repeat protein [Candidatus Pacearchaeota archaeon]|nr:tetratricopeptide repeat protein [Candidatus Pacearchaeota archaeon]